MMNKAQTSLDQRLSWIGFRIESSKMTGERCPAFLDIEGTLLQAFQEGLIQEDHRLIGVALSWLKVHGGHLILERFIGRGRREWEGETLQGWLSALCAYAHEFGHRNWKSDIARGPRAQYLFGEAYTRSLIERKGAEPVSELSNFWIPKGSLRIREEDVEPASRLAATNPTYRNRYLIGPNLRADLISALQAGAKSPTELQRAVGCSFEPAFRVFSEYQVLRAAAS